MNSAVAEIRSRGHWRVTIHPMSFEESRVPYDQLLPVLERCVVELRGWDFPHMDRNEPVQRNLKNIEQQSRWQHHAERWMFFQSGLFTSVATIASDWRDRSEWWPAPSGWTPGKSLGLFDSLWTYLEIYEFASRLSRQIPGDDLLRVKAVVGPLSGRVLTDDSAPGRFTFRGGSTTAVEEFPIDSIHSREDLLANATNLAADAARQLYSRFNFNPDKEAVLEWIRLLKARQL